MASTPFEYTSETLIGPCRYCGGPAGARPVAIGEDLAPPALIRALALVRAAAAQVNGEWRDHTCCGLRNVRGGPGRRSTGNGGTRAVSLAGRRGRGLFARLGVAGLEPRTKVLAGDVAQAVMLATALVPQIGYDAAAKIARDAYRRHLSLREAALASRLVHENEFERLVRPERMLEPDSGPPVRSTPRAGG